MNSVLYILKGFSLRRILLLPEITAHGIQYSTVASDSLLNRAEENDANEDIGLSTQAILIAAPESVGEEMDNIATDAWEDEEPQLSLYAWLKGLAVAEEEFERFKKMIMVFWSLLSNATSRSGRRGRW